MSINGLGYQSHGWLPVVLLVLAFALRRFGYPIVPMLMGVILGPYLEEFLRRSLALSNGDPTTFFTNPDSLFFVALTLVFVYFLVIRKPAKAPAAATSK